jgi:hypothetical protein
MNPEMKLIYLVRDPIQRILSHYVDNVHRGVERSSIEDVLQGNFDQNGYVSTSRYYFQLERYLQVFDQEQILVIQSERLRKERLEVLSEVFGFLGVNPDFRTSEFRDEQHQTKEKDVPIPLARRLADNSVIRRLKELTPRPIETLIRTAIRKPASQPDLPADLHDSLRQYLSTEVNQLRKETGMQFSGWDL